MASIARIYRGSRFSYGSLIALNGQANDKLVDDFFDTTSPEPIGSVSPASTALTGYWPNTYAGAPNVGVASASPGTSLNNDQTAGATGWSNPGIGTGLNAFASSTFDGANVGQVADDTAATMLGTAEWSYGAVVKTTAQGVRTTSYANPPLWSDNASVAGVSVSDGGISAFQFDASAADVETPLIPFPNDTWALVQAKWDRNVLYCRVNNGPWSTIATSTFFARGTDIWLGRTGYAALNGEKLAEMFAKYAWTKAQADGFGVWAEARYDTEFGFTFPGTFPWAGAWEGGDYNGTTWAARTSVGQSAVNGPLTSGGFAPSVGATANGRSSADFSGATKLDNANDVTVFVGQNSAAFSISGVVAIDTAAARTVGGGNADAAIVSDNTNGYFYVTATTSGITVGYFDTGSVYREINKACAADGLPHTFHAWLFGGTLNLVVDGVAATPVTGCANTRNAAIGALQVGQNYDLTKHFDGRLWSLRVAPVDVGPTVRSDLEAYYRARYFSTSSVTLALPGLRAFSRLGKLTAAGLNTLILRGARIEASVGKASFTTAATVAVSGVPSDARVGRALVVSLNTVALSGVDSVARSGRVTFTPGVATMALAGVETRGSSGRVTFAAGPVSVAPAGLASDARVGRASIGSLYTVSLPGLSAKGRASSGLLTTSYTVSLGGVPARSRVGVATVVPGSVSLVLVGGRSRAGASSGSLATFATMTPSGVPVDARVGRATLQASNLVQLAGLRGRAVSGSATVVPGAVAAALSGVASRSRVGLVVVGIGGGAPSALTLSGIRSDALAGLLAVSSTATIAPRGARADARVGLGVLASAVTISLRGVRSRSTAGRASLTTVATIALSGAAAESRSGVLATTTFYALAPVGVRAKGRVGRSQVTSLVALALAGLRGDGVVGAGVVAAGAVSLSLGGVTSEGRAGRVVVFRTFDATIALAGISASAALGRVFVYFPADAVGRLRDAPAARISLKHVTAADFTSADLRSTRPKIDTDVVTTMTTGDAPGTRMKATMSNYPYNIGDDVALTLELKNRAGALVDATTIALTVRSPAGVASTPAVTHPATGKYEATVDATESGTWRYRWTSTGSAKGVEEGYFEVKPNSF